MPVSNNDLLKEIRLMATKFDNVTERLDNMDEKLNNNISDINNQITQVQTSLTNEITVVKDGTNNELVKLGERIAALESNKGNIGKIMDLIINGIPCLADEDLKSIILKISFVIQFEDEQSICGISRLQTPKETSFGVNNGAPVILNFTSTHSRRIFHMKYFLFTKKDKLKLSHIGLDSHDRIYINENLTKHGLDLLKRAKQLKKNGKITSAYSYDGKVCVYQSANDKEYQIVSSFDDLKKYE